MRSTARGQGQGQGREPSDHQWAGMAVRDSNGFGRGLDSGGFGGILSSPAGEFLAILYSLYGHFDPTEMGSGFGRIR